MMFLAKFLLIFTLSSALYDTVEEKKGLVFETVEWDFGEIEVKDGPVAYDFWFKNTSDKTITIGELVPSCYCVQANIADKEIEAGEEGKIQFVFNPYRTGGLTYRTLDVFSEDGKQITTLSIFADCLR